MLEDYKLHVVSSVCVMSQMIFVINSNYFPHIYQLVSVLEMLYFLFNSNYMYLMFKEFIKISSFIILLHDHHSFPAVQIHVLC